MSSLRGQDGIKWRNTDIEQLCTEYIGKWATEPDEQITEEHEKGFKNNADTNKALQDLMRAPTLKEVAAAIRKLKRGVSAPGLSTLLLKLTTITTWYEDTNVSNTQLNNNVFNLHQRATVEGRSTKTTAVKTTATTTRGN